MELPKVDLSYVNLSSTNYRYLRAVILELDKADRIKINSLKQELVDERDQHLVNEKIRHDAEDLADREINAELQKKYDEKRKRSMEEAKVYAIKNAGVVQPEIEYDPHATYIYKLHQPEMHIIYDLLNNEISNFTKKTSYGAMCVRLRKKFKKRMIGETYSTENFDRRIETNTPINAIPKPELIGNRIFTIEGHDNLEGYKLARRNRRISDAKRKRQKEKEVKEHEAYMLRLEAERSSGKNSETLKPNVE